MPSEYATAINIIAVLSIIFGLIRRWKISWINKKENELERDSGWRTSDKPPREEAKSKVRVSIYAISFLLFLILFAPVGSGNAPIESGMLAEALGLLIYAFAVWLPVELGIVAIVGVLLYLILQYEGFTTG